MWQSLSRLRHSEQAHGPNGQRNLTAVCNPPRPKGRIVGRCLSQAVLGGAMPPQTVRDEPPPYLPHAPQFVPCSRSASTYVLLQTATHRADRTACTSSRSVDSLALGSCRKRFSAPLSALPARPAA
eukprot:350275-Chlamydomonas_euryale.AAC.3